MVKQELLTKFNFLASVHEKLSYNHFEGNTRKHITVPFRTKTLMKQNVFETEPRLISVWTHFLISFRIRNKSGHFH